MTLTRPRSGGFGKAGSVAEAVVANGGRLVMERTAIPGVGELVFFEDPSGNVAGAIHYDRD